MSRAPRGSRSARGGVIAVGAAELPPTARPVVRAANLFEALGEVTVATAQHPVAAVLVPAGLARVHGGDVAGAFHRLDPAVRVVLVGGEAAERDGFDAVLAVPLDEADLEAVISGEQAPMETPPAAPAPPAPDSRALAPAGTPAPQTPAPPAGRAAGPLGDVDLVEAILREPSGLETRAIALIRQQTGWSDAVLRTTAPPDEPGAEVVFANRRFGVLSSRVAGERELRPWAEWLARWLALDRGYREFRTMAFRDELTGAHNRRFFEIFMAETLRRAARQRMSITLLVFDIDDFKLYNDRFGHDAGDEILVETVRLLNSVIRAGDKVCRIGGDEFVVVFADAEGPRRTGSRPPERVEQIAARFQDQICKLKFPKLGPDAPGSLSVSGGLATYPWEGVTAAELLRRADQLAIQSKRAGKNVISMGPAIRVERKERR